MTTLIQALDLYFREILGLEVDICRWKKTDCLPFFLVNTYDFYRLSMWGHSCLLMVPKAESILTPTTIKKHRNQVQERWSGYCIYVQESVTPYNRQRLIHHRVPFIVPRNQMYLPDLGVDLREYFHQARAKRELLSPATQAVVIHALCQGPSKECTASVLTKTLGYSRMTILRAFNELEVAGIGVAERKGRDRYWVYEGSRTELWRQASAILSSPIRSQVWVKDKVPMIKAGLSALEERSMLGSTQLPTYAISLADWKNWQAWSLATAEGAKAKVEIWNYDPRLFSDQNLVDVFSLYLSLKETKDERVESALDEMMENIEWLEG